MARYDDQTQPTAKHDDDKNAKNAEKQSAEQLRQQAMERMRKRKGNDGEGSGKKSRRSGVELVEYLREKTESEKELRQQELDNKKTRNRIKGQAT